MNITDTVSSEEAAAALGVRPPTVRTLIKGGRLSASRFGRGWRVHTASINALLALTSSPQANPASASSPALAKPAPSPPPVLQGNPANSPIFTADDDWLLTYANELTRHADPRVALLAAKVVMLHRDLAGCQAVKPAPPKVPEPVTAEQAAAFWGLDQPRSRSFDLF
jgi:excisionase family DNA binding protein